MERCAPPAGGVIRAFLPIIYIWTLYPSPGRNHRGTSGERPGHRDRQRRKPEWKPICLPGRSPEQQGGSEHQPPHKPDDPGRDEKVPAVLCRASGRIEDRIWTLEAQERWDIEQTLEANASILGLFGLFMALVVRSRLFIPAPHRSARVPPLAFPCWWRSPPGPMLLRGWGSAPRRGDQLSSTACGCSGAISTPSAIA